MEDRPTVQMDSNAPTQRGSVSSQAQTPPTVPMEDMRRPAPGWPPPVQPASPFPPPPAQPQFAQPQPPPPQHPQRGATVVMGPVTPPPPLAWLAVLEGPGAPRGQVFTMQRETAIGRTAGNIVLSGDACVSSQHAKIRLEPSEADPEKPVYVLYDLASANGTFAGNRNEYQDRRIYRHELHDGDFVLIGETTLVFKEV